jgi:hypothetical protein
MIMKKILLSALLASMSTGLFAQFSKGAMAITGTVGFNGSKNSITTTNVNTSTTTPAFDQKISGFAFVPAFSYFFTDRVEGGLALALTKSTTTNDFHPSGGNPNATRTTKSENPLNGVALFGNYYFRVERNYACYGGIQLGVGSGTGKVTTTPVVGDATIVETQNNGSTFGLNAGFIYFVRSNLAFNTNFGLLSFNNIKTESTSSGTRTNTENSSWVLGVNGIIVNIGLKLFLRTNADAGTTTATAAP